MFCCDLHVNCDHVHKSFWKLVWSSYEGCPYVTNSTVQSQHRIPSTVSQLTCSGRCDSSPASPGRLLQPPQPTASPLPKHKARFSKHFLILSLEQYEYRDGNRVWIPAPKQPETRVHVNIVYLRYARNVVKKTGMWSRKEKAGVQDQLQGVQPVQPHGTPHSEGPSALLSSLEIFNHFLLDLECISYKIQIV